MLLHIKHPSQHIFLAAHSSIALQTLGLATFAALGQLLLSKFEAISRPKEKHTHFWILGRWICWTHLNITKRADGSLQDQMLLGIWWWFVTSFMILNEISRYISVTKQQQFTKDRNDCNILEANWLEPTFNELTKQLFCFCTCPVIQVLSLHVYGHYGGPSYSTRLSVRCHNAVFDSFSDTWMGARLAIGLAAAHAPMAQFQEIMSRCLATNRCEHSQHLPTHHPIIQSTSVYLLSVQVQMINGNDFHQPEQKKNMALLTHRQ